uniref:Uncharacterized protein n=1 Tax=Triticum urartu TaxID=4572 RepID=A0A8R7TFX5_TRIUA
MGERAAGAEADAAATAPVQRRGQVLHHQAASSRREMAAARRARGSGMWLEQVFPMPWSSSPRRRLPQQLLGVWRRNWWMRSSRTRSSRIFHASRSSPNSLQDMSAAAGAGKSRALQKRGSFPLDLLVRRKRSGETRGRRRPARGEA